MRRRRIGSLRNLVFMFQNNYPSNCSNRRSEDKSLIVDLTNGTSRLRWACDVDEKGAFDSHQTIAIQRDLETQQGRHVDSYEGEMEIGRQQFGAHDRGSRSRLDRGKITMRFGPRLFPSDGPPSSCNRGHQFHFSTR